MTLVATSIIDRNQENKEWDSINLTRLDKGVRTPLHLAVLDRKMPIKTKYRKIKYLLDRGADVNARTRDGQTPMHFASRFADLKTMEILLASGANAKARDDFGITPLFWVGQQGTKEQAELLIENGAEVDAPDGFGLTPLHQAVFAGRAEVVECLLSNGANPNYSTRDGETPRMAASERRPELLSMFELYKTNAPVKEIARSQRVGTIQAVTPDGVPVVQSAPVPVGDGSTFFSIGGAPPPSQPEVVP